MHEHLTPNEYESTPYKAAAALCETLLQYKASDQLSFADLPIIGQEAAKVHEALLDTPFSDLIPRDEELLSIDDPRQGGIPGTELYADTANIGAPLLRAWKWEYPSGVETSETDAAYELDISLLFSNGETTATQTVALHVSPRNPPQLSRNTYMIAYAETGYEGHDVRSRTASDEELTAFTELAQNLITPTLEKIEQGA